MMEIIREAWGWIGIKPKEIIRENDFGNIIIKDEKEKYWRIIPEELQCIIIANNIKEFEELNNDEEFKLDWEMKDLINIAQNKFGKLGNSKKYCLKLPGVLGGKYSEDNFGTINFEELISFAGNLAFKIKDLPDGSKIKLEIGD